MISVYYFDFYNNIRFISVHYFLVRKLFDDIGLIMIVKTCLRFQKLQVFYQTNTMLRQV